MLSNSIAALLRDACQDLKSLSDTPQLDAEVLLLHALNYYPSERTYHRAFLRTWPEYQPSAEQLKFFYSCLQQRLKGIPVPYITGKREFWSMEMEVDQSTLIPRPDTETLVEAALNCIPEKAEWNILDLGTGSGAIALALAKERPRSNVYAVDYSYSALKIAKRNAKQLKIGNVYFYQGSWLNGVVEYYFHLIVSNPPYVVDNDPHLQQGDVRFEPRSALASGPDGLDDIRIILAAAKRHLRDNGRILIEHGYDQAKAVQQELGSKKYQCIKQIKDLSNIIRVSSGKV